MNGLNDKTVVIAGPFGLMLQNLISRLAEYGADVAVITDDAKSASRVCQNIMDMREVSEKFGRAAAIQGQISDSKSAENSFSQSAEIFGGTDVYIDTHLFGLSIPFFTENTGDISSAFQKAFGRTELMTKIASSFLKARTRSRIIFMLHELDMWAAEKANIDVFTEFSKYVYQLNRNLAENHTAVNALAIGVNEEYLLTRFAKSLTIQKSLQKLQETIPHAKLVDYSEIGHIISFMASPMSSGISGQIIRCNHGL